MKDFQITLPEAIVELIKLERKYPSLDIAPLDVRDKMTAQALSIGGIQALSNDSVGYLRYLEKLDGQLYELYLSGTENQISKLREKIAWLMSNLHSHYTEQFSRVRVTQQKLADIYVRVEKYRVKNPEAKIKHSTDAVAIELEMDPKYVHTRYYEFRKKVDNMPIDEVIQKFQLPTTS